MNADPKECPQCGQPNVVTEHEACIEPYGECPDVVKLVFVRPLHRCLKCGLIFTAMDGEKAQEDALAMYRRVLCPNPNIRFWIENVKDRKLAHIAPGIIDEVVKAWEIYRGATVEAGGGLEPPTPGV